ncbi:hypothetical protein [Caloramator sp. Dgby_cultured_2]|uniref:hypothetical protein n=1 Tax=Caloramator sp. Dgby_cultured_2 TaxID=3029174 RepID=UPI00237DAB44|nr:hypothetical protein [Caloramator sp. Dgby_cultured_2]WDU84192.1 hypothetical protein PWK10_07695 [Caloramator sp. Dgby_cultured_2]
MKFLGDLIQIDANKYRVGFIHNFPFHPQHGLGKTQEELEQEGILIEELPEPQQIEGKIAVLYCNPVTKDVWYEYEDRPLTKEEQLELQIKTLQETILELLGV